MRPVGMVSSPTSDDRSEVVAHLYSLHQSQLPGRENRRTEVPKDGAKITCNLGIAYVS
jgi:hypothetical protein